MIAKTFEIRDRATFIPVLAVKLAPGCEADRFLMARAGYGLEPERQSEYVVLFRLTDNEATYDPYKWKSGPRTMPTAHRFIRDNFDELMSGAVVDVEFVLGEASKPKASEALGGL